MRAEAREIFVKEQKTQPTCVFGPFFEAKLTQIASSSKKESIRIPEEDIQYSRRKIRAVCNGWHAIGRFIEAEDGTERQDIVHLSFKKEVQPSEKPRMKPQPRLERIENITNIEEII